MHNFNHFSQACIERLDKSLIILTLVIAKHPGNNTANAFSGNCKQDKREMQIGKKKSPHRASTALAFSISSVIT